MGLRIVLDRKGARNARVGLIFFGPQGCKGRKEGFGVIDFIWFWMRWIVTFCLLLPFCGFSQDSSLVLKPSIPSEVEIICYCDIEAAFPGGTQDLMRYIESRFGVVGGDPSFTYTSKVYAEFIVNENGSISDISVNRCDHPLLEEAIVRMIQGMPRWIPSEYEGKKVRTRVRLPIAIDWK